MIAHAYMLGFVLGLLAFSVHASSESVGWMAADALVVLLNGQMMLSEIRREAQQ